MAFDRTNPADLLALKTEVNTDPTGLGYAPDAGTGGLLDLLNGKNPATLVQKPKISSAAVRSAVTYDAYNTLAIDEQEWLRWLTGSNGFEEENLPVSADLRLQLTGDGTPTNSFWSAAQRTVMVAAMLAIMDVPGSRAEILWGFGTSISRDDWIAARDS